MATTAQKPLTEHEKRLKKMRERAGIKEDAPASPAPTPAEYDRENMLQSNARENAREGLYNPKGVAHSWRLRGAVRTAADGTFEFNTIRPASYPQTRIPQHVHVILQTADGRFHAGEWRFADDPMVDASERARSEAAGTFGWVRPVRTESGVATIQVVTRLDPSRRA